MPSPSVSGAWIYVLIDPETNQHRYVGSTGRSPRGRLSAHVREADPRRRDLTTPHHVWIRSLLAKGLRPRMELMASAGPIYRRFIESECIRNCRLDGCLLTNASNPWKQNYDRSQPAESIA